MPTAKTKDAVVAYLRAAFAGDARVEIKPLRNAENPTPPKSEAELDGKATIYLQFPPTRIARAGIGPAAPKDEAGVFYVHVLVASHSAPAAALAEAVAKTAADALASKPTDDGVEIFDFLEGDGGSLWGGNFWGESFAVEFETQNV